MIQTKTGRDGKRDAPNQSELRAEYSDMIVNFRHIESEIADSYDNGYEEVLLDIKRSIRKIKEHSEIGEAFINIRQAIRDLQAKIKGKKDDKKLLSWEEYLEITRKNGILEGAAINPLSLLENWLVKTGVVYYRRGLMNDQIILNQEWAIDAIYSILDRKRHYKTFKNKKGIIAGADLESIWAEIYDKEVQELFVDFMLSCELCFETTPPIEKEAHRWRKHPPLSERSFIMPQLLTENRKDLTSLDTIWRLQPKSWFYRFEHKLMHYGIIQSFIVRAKSLAKPHNIWKMGIFLEEGNHFAEVKAFEKRIDIRVSEDKVLLDKILNELSSILHYKKGIIESVSTDGNNYVRLEDLKKADKRNKTIPALNGKRVALQPLLHFLQTNKQVKLASEEEKHIGLQHVLKSTPAMNTKQRVINLLRQGKTEEAIAFFNQNHGTTDSIMLSNRFRELRKKILRGTISDSDATTQRNIIVDNLLEAVKAATNESIEPLELPDIKVPKPPAPASKVRKILFLAASPDDMSRTKATKEHREIKAELERGSDRDSFDFLPSQFALNLAELIRAFDDKPNIVHFSGHGKKDGILIMNQNDEAVRVPIRPLKRLFARLKGDVEMVLLNSCYSANQAQAISEFDIYVLGNNKPISNEAGISLAEAIYNRLGQGKTFMEAFEAGLMSLEIHHPEYADSIEVWKDGERLEI